MTEEIINPERYRIFAVNSLFEIV